MLRVVKLLGIGAALVVVTLAFASGGKQLSWAQQQKEPSQAKPFTWQGTFIRPKGWVAVLAYYSYSQEDYALCGELKGNKGVTVDWETGSKAAKTWCSAQGEKSIPSSKGLVKTEGNNGTWNLTLYLAKLFWDRTKDQATDSNEDKTTLKYGKCQDIVNIKKDGKRHTIILAMNVKGNDEPGKALVYEKGNISSSGFFVSTGPDSSLVFVETGYSLTVCAGGDAKAIDLSWKYLDIAWQWR